MSFMNKTCLFDLQKPVTHTCMVVVQGLFVRQKKIIWFIETVLLVNSINH